MLFFLIIWLVSELQLGELEKIRRYSFLRFYCFVPQVPITKSQSKNNLFDPYEVSFSR